MTDRVSQFEIEINQQEYNQSPANVYDRWNQQLFFKIQQQSHDRHLRKNMTISSVDYAEVSKEQEMRGVQNSPHTSKHFKHSSDAFNTDIETAWPYIEP